MKRVIKIILVIILLLIVTVAIGWFGFLKPEPLPISVEDREKITLMPLPSELELKNGVFKLPEDFGFEFKNETSRKVQAGVKRFYSNLEKKTGIIFSNKGPVKLLINCLSTTEKYPDLGDDESYEIEVEKNRIMLSAKTETGILYGFETLLQLVNQENGSWIIPTLEMVDSPRYPWRGLMIDVGRHFIPKDVILRNIDAMVAAKMNVLHWHLTEYQGFRVESKVFPKLHEEGSNGEFYTQTEIIEILNYAKDRGVRVVPEFDIPGHSTSWFLGYPELASAPGPYKLDSIFGVLEPVMDPTKDFVYKFLDKFLGEMTTLFPDEYLHIGGDEVSPKHWNENKNIQKFMGENEIKDPHELQAYFNSRIHKILKNKNKKMMGWDEIAHPDLPKDDLVIQTWRNQKSLWESARNGYKSVLSAGYYLDYKYPAETHYKIDPAVIEGAVNIDIDSTNWKSWKCEIKFEETLIQGNLYLFGEGKDLRGIVDFMDSPIGFENIELENDKSFAFNVESSFGKVNYNLTTQEDSITGKTMIALFKLNLKGIRSGGSDMKQGEPLPKFEKLEPLNEVESENLIGGEACIWTELVDKNSLESRIWPRAAAIAEKLWSPKVLTNNSNDMYRRLKVFNSDQENRGLQHIQNSNMLLKSMVSEEYFEPLRMLVEVLNEDVFFNRMSIYSPRFYITTPLNRIVDASHPESYVAYDFNKKVENWIISKDDIAKQELIYQLNIWIENCKKLDPAFIEGNRIFEVAQHSKNLLKLSRFVLKKLNNKTFSEVEKSEINLVLIEAHKPNGGTLLSVVDGLEKIIQMK